MQIALTTPDPGRDALAAFGPPAGPTSPASARERQLAFLVSTWLAASAHRVAPADLSLMRRGSGDVVAARQLAIYLVHVVFGFDRDCTAKLFGRDRRTVARACAKLEDQRESAEAERTLCAIEREALALAETLGLEPRA
ncbi:hypothetical protein [Blastochloris viridis]|uniref:Chromosomal replication initiator protein DnaA n=1 Tax=Blastochloris viridis TaxID=1079 RepID=A0A0H5BPV7_BLAVI|nr:hypothetical protein [Blastochloris viridis]ALK10137.1 hypothetical protein BVIR_2370 [Blastochloris viridis]BAR99933.1 hypothetical protein BV133_2340 [Blastochloris viridis]CUU42801.1 hypothetical protein BVIRIDIS_18160 [Blastochloris viridis]